MIYQRISLSTSEPVGEPGPLPFAVAGWAGNPELLADLSGLDPAYELTDAGFWPVIVEPAPDHDPAIEQLQPGALVADTGNRTFLRVWDVTPLPIETRKAARIAAVKALVDAKLAAGAPVVVGQDVLHVALDDGARADMGAMATTAIAVGVTSGTVPWPESYQLGWITIENIRIPLPAPADGLAIAALIGDHYAQIRQHGRDLKDAIAAAQDDAAFDAIDIEAGWPA